MLVLLWMLPLTLMAQESKDSLSINLPSTLTEQDIRELTAPIRVENTGYTQKVRFYPVGARGICMARIFIQAI